MVYAFLSVSIASVPRFWPRRRCEYLCIAGSGIGRGGVWAFFQQH